MTIPDPIAREGDPVLALNYRLHPPMWERGVAADPVFYLGNYPPPGQWHYVVSLDRRSATGRLIRVTVGDAGIKPTCKRRRKDRADG